MEKREVTFGTFEEAIQKTEVPDKISSFTVYQLGLAGEIGELLTEFKKDKRGDVGDVGFFFCEPSSRHLTFRLESD